MVSKGDSFCDFTSYSSGRAGCKDLGRLLEPPFILSGPDGGTGLLARCCCLTYTLLSLTLIERAPREGRCAQAENRWGRAREVVLEGGNSLSHQTCCRDGASSSEEEEKERGS